jgi:D-aminopeptidase
VQAFLAEQGRGFKVRSARVPIVPAAILFDLLNGGDKNWGRYPPYRELGYAAAQAAAESFALGSVGAGLGATTVNLKGGVGSASASVREYIVGALAAINAAGSVTIGDGPHFWAAPYERNDEFGGRGLPWPFPAEALSFRSKGMLGESTALVIVATNAPLSKPQVRRLAIMAQDGLARAIRPVHTPLDGDIVFAAALAGAGARALTDPIAALAELGTAAADVVARAIARGVYEAEALPFPDALPAWRDQFGA